MSKRSVIHIKKNSPTVIEFNLEVTGIDKIKKTSAVLMVEDVIKGCDVAIRAKHVKDEVWSVTVPNLKNFKDVAYPVRLEVVVDGYHFTPASGTMKLINDPKIEMVSETYEEGDQLNEGINSGSGSASGPDDQITNRTMGTPEFEPDDIDINNALDYSIGTNDDEAIDDTELDPTSDSEKPSDEHQDEIDAIVRDVLSKAGISQKVKARDINKDETKIDDIASSINGVEGPQLPFDDIDLDDLDDNNEDADVKNSQAKDQALDHFDVKETVNLMLRTMLPIVKKPATSGNLISKTVKAKISGDTKYLKEVEAKNKKIRKAIK